MKRRERLQGIIREHYGDGIDVVDVYVVDGEVHVQGVNRTTGQASCLAYQPTVPLEFMAGGIVAAVTAAARS